MPDDASPNAPTEPVVAAFDVEATAEAWLLTANTYHVLRLGDLSWVASGPLRGPSSPFPDFSGTPIGAFGISPGSPAGRSQAIVVLRSGDAHIFEVLDASARTWQWVLTTNPVMSDPAWSGSGAPAWSAIRAGWFTRANPHGWLPRLPSGCSTTLADANYQVILTATRAHPYVAGCGFLETPLALSTFGPFVASGSPPANAIAATFYRERSGHLWVVTP